MSLVSVFKIFSVYGGNKKIYQCLRHSVVRALEIQKPYFKGWRTVLPKPRFVEGTKMKEVPVNPRMRGSLREVNEKDLFHSRCQIPSPSYLGARLLLADKRQWGKRWSLQAGATCSIPKISLREPGHLKLWQGRRCSPAERRYF